MSQKHPSIWLLVAVLMVVIVLAGCSNPEDKATPAAAITPETTSEPALPTRTSQAPLSIRIENTMRPAIDPACLEGSPDTFQLRSGPQPATGLVPGFNYLFCAVGAADGATVDFNLVDPAGVSHSTPSLSFVQDGLTVAPFSLRITPADPAGMWTLTAQSGDLSAQTTFNVQAASQPFIALSEPLSDNAQLIRASIGGLATNGSARFALYSITGPNAAQPNIAEAVLLISTRLSADDTGRADLELDVADLPSGPYMLLLLPAEVDLGAPPSLKLPAQENLVVAVNITRPLPADTEIAGAGAEATPTAPDTPLVPSEEAIPPEPQPVAVGGGLPSTIQVHLPTVELPACVPADSPQLRLWPSAGEIGQWWHGCASGFAPGNIIQFTVTQANNDTTTFLITADASGTAPFRWYSAPGEGAGKYRIVAENSSGKATLNFKIQPTSNPHVLVFPHDYTISVGGQLNLSGFPAQSQVQLALYALDAQGNGAKIKEWQVKTNKWGAYKSDFIQAFALESGDYAVVAQGGPAFQFSGVDLAASALDFFSYNSEPNPSLEFYTLYLGRTEGAVVAATEPGPTPVPPTPTPAPASTPASPTPQAATTPAEIPPLTVSLPAADGARPTCPDAPAQQPAICLVPDTLPRGTFVALLMHGFAANTSFRVTVTPPNGVHVILSVRADAEGYADATWYALNDEKLGTYKVSIRGGGKTFKGSFDVVKPQQPHVVVQPRSPQEGTPAIISVAGFSPREELLIVRYRQTGATDDQVQFERVDVTAIKTGGIGGGQQLFRTRANQKGQLFLVQVYRPGQAEPLAQAVYQVGTPLKMRYPLTWAQNFIEGQ